MNTKILICIFLLIVGIATATALVEPTCVHENDIKVVTETILINGHGTGLIVPNDLQESDFVVPTRASIDLRLMDDLPTSWDWREEGDVTPVKDQGQCGSCYAFATLGMIEGDILVDGGSEYDFSEEQSKECIWEAQNTGVGGCNGGWAVWVINLLTRVGIVLEADDPYIADDTSCNSSTTPEKRVTDWYMLSGGIVPPDDTLKSYIYANGPIFTAFDADCLEDYDGGVISGAGYNEINHAVVIVGWNDSLGDEGAWIVKNSWGTDFGNEGYFYIAYGGAEIGSFSSVISGYEDYQSNVRTINYDESGWKNAWGYSGQDDTWCLCKFDSDIIERITDIEFWTTGSTSDVDLYLYDGFDGVNLGSQLYADENLNFNEPGYHSVPVNDVIMSIGEIVVVAHITNTNSVYYQSMFYPIASDGNDQIESEKTYLSIDGTDGSWLDLGGYATEDVALRIRLAESDSPVIKDVWIECSGDAPDALGVINGYDCCTAGDMVTVYAEVCDPNEDIDTVMANFSEHGIEELVEMTIVESDGDCALYSGEVQITQSSCHFEDYWDEYYYYWWCIHTMECDELPVEVNATDMEGQYDTDEADFYVKPAEPHHLEVTGPDAKFEFPMEWDSKMEKKMCCWDDANWWGGENGWENCRDFNSTVAYLNVLLFDQYGNIVNDDLCYRNLYITNNGTNPLVHAGHCCWDNWDEYGETCHSCCNKLWVVDEIPEDVEFTVFYCEDDERAEVLMLLSDLPEGVACDTHVVTFTNLTDTLDVSVEDVDVYKGGDLTANVSAQLVDEYNNPIAVERVPVMFSTGDPNIAEIEPEWVLTDENGIATSILNSYDGTDDGIVTVYAASECRSEDTEFEVLEGPYTINITCDTDYMVANDSCCDPDTTVVTVQLLNDSDMSFMCGGIDVVVKIVYDTDDCEQFGDVTPYTTTADGSFTFVLNSTDTPGNITICGETICDIRDKCTIDVIAPIMDTLMIVRVEPIVEPFEPGNEQMTTTVGWNTSRIVAMCPVNCTYNYTIEDPIAEWENASINYTYDGCNRRIPNTLTAISTGTTNVTVSCGEFTSGNLSITVIAPEPDPDPVRRSSSGGGTYPLPPQTNTTDTGGNNTTVVEPTPEPTPKVTPKLPTAPGTAPAPASTSTPTPDPTGWDLPGFSIFAAISIMIVAYFVIRRRD